MTFNIVNGQCLHVKVVESYKALLARDTKGRSPQIMWLV